MHALRTLVALSLILAPAMSPEVLAQEQHLVDRAALAAAVAEHAAGQAADRAALREALARPEVRELAAATGIGIDRLADAVGTLDGEELAQAASAARAVNDSLVGGQSTLTISTTTIIIALLVVILLIVAID